MKVFCITFHYFHFLFLSDDQRRKDKPKREFPSDKPPVEHLLVYAENSESAASKAKALIEEKHGINSYGSPKVEELKLFEVPVERFMSAKEAAQYPEDWYFARDKNIIRFYATDIEEAEKVVCLMPSAHTLEHGGYCLDDKVKEVS